MARIYTTGFELQSITAGVELTGAGLGGAGSISTTTVRSGAASLRINPTASFSWMAQNAKGSASATEMFTRVYFRFAAFPASGLSDVLTIADTGGVVMRAIARFDSSDSKIKVYDQASTLINSSAAISLNTWYCLEMRVIGGAGGTGTIQAKLDQTQFASNTAVTVGNFSGFYLGGAFNSGTYDIFYDDIAVNDTSGGSQNTWPGPGNVIRLTPDAAGDANSFATQTGGTAGSANNYTRVDETTPNDATDFNGSSTLNEEDLFNCTASGVASYDTVNVVHVGFRFRNSTADATAVIKVEIEKASAGTILQSSAITPNSTTWKTNGTTTAVGFPITAYTDPDGAAWTNTTLDSMQIGYKLTTGPGTAGRRIDVTTVWAYVDYTPGSPPASTNSNFFLFV